MDKNMPSLPAGRMDTTSSCPLHPSPARSEFGEFREGFSHWVRGVAGKISGVHTTGPVLQ